MVWRNEAVHFIYFYLDSTCYGAFQVGTKLNNFVSVFGGLEDQTFFVCELLAIKAALRSQRQLHTVALGCVQISKLLSHFYIRQNPNDQFVKCNKNNELFKKTSQSKLPDPELHLLGHNYKTDSNYQPIDFPHCTINFPCLLY